MNGLKKKEKERRLKKGMYKRTRDGESSTENSGGGKRLTLSSYMQSKLCNDCGMSHSEITKMIGIYDQ